MKYFWNKINSILIAFDICFLILHTKKTTNKNYINLLWKKIRLSNLPFQ